MSIEFEDVYPKMSTEEREEYFMYSMCGMWDRANNIVMMGSDAYTRAMFYQQEMINKYSSLLLQKEEEKQKKIKPKIKSEQTWKKKWKRN